MNPFMESQDETRTLGTDTQTEQCNSGSPLVCPRPPFSQSYLRFSRLSLLLFSPPLHPVYSLNPNRPTLLLNLCLRLPLTPSIPSESQTFTQNSRMVHGEGHNPVRNLFYPFSFSIGGKNLLYRNKPFSFTVIRLYIISYIVIRLTQPSLK